MSSWQNKLDDADAPLYTIGVVAEVLGVTVPAIRRYDDAGAVTPERSTSGQRRYSRRDIERLAHALRLADEGISPPGITRILDLEEQLREARGDGSYRSSRT